MLIRRVASGMFSIALLSAGAASGQAFPEKPIRIVASAVGGGTDFVSRLIAPGVSGHLGQPVIIDNRGGAQTVTGEIVARAAPDGYTLMVASGSFVIEPLLHDGVPYPYDPFRDFAPITTISVSPNVLAVNPSLPATVKEFIAHAKTRPGALNYGSGSTGGASHLATELFSSMAGINLVRITYKGSQAGINAVLANEVQLMFAGVGQVMPHAKSGKLRALGVTSAEPSTVAPGLPPIAATLPGYEAVSLLGIFSPAKTPAAIIKRLNQEIVRVLNDAPVKQKLLEYGEQAVGGSPEDLTVRLKSQAAKMGKVIKDAGIRAE